MNDVLDLSNEEVDGNIFQIAMIDEREDEAREQGGVEKCNE